MSSSFKVASYSYDVASKIRQSLHAGQQQQHRSFVTIAGGLPAVYVVLCLSHALLGRAFQFFPLQLNWQLFCPSNQWQIIRLYWYPSKVLKLS